MMSAREFAFVGCRLLALYWGLDGIYSIADLLQGFLSWESLDGSLSPQETAESKDLIVRGRLISIALYLMLAVVFWISAKGLSTFITGSEGSDEEDRTSFREWQAVAFSAVGLFIVFSTIPGIGGQFYKSHLLHLEFGNTAQASVADKADQVQLAIQFIVGILLLLGGRSLSGILSWLRELGGK